eukprot:2987667-Rhodomonas_salina.3
MRVGACKKCSARGHCRGYGCAVLCCAVRYGARFYLSLTSNVLLPGGNPRLDCQRRELRTQARCLSLTSESAVANRGSVADGN